MSKKKGTKKPQDKEGSKFGWSDGDLVVVKKDDSDKPTPKPK